MTTKLTKREATYIKDMFKHDTPWIKKITDISQLPIGWAAFFIENRELESARKWPLDHSLSKKYLTFHKLPLTMTYKQWDKWGQKQKNVGFSPLAPKE